MTDGPTLYANNCAACHKPLATSTKGGATLTRIQNAISGNVGGMGGLSSLTTTQLQAIVAALATVSPPPPPTVTDGPTLYANNCAACHKPLATSAKAGATLTRTQNAITRQHRRHGLPVVADDHAAAGDRRGARDGEPRRRR